MHFSLTVDLLTFVKGTTGYHLWSAFVWNLPVLCFAYIDLASFGPYLCGFSSIEESGSVFIFLHLNNTFIPNCLI